jgi:ADP-heptose:LPS heptosyltransferase
MKILVRGPNWLGDAIFARPFHKGLREHYRDAELVLLSHPRALGAGEEEFFDRVLTLTPGKPISEKFDLAVTLPASLSSAFLLWRMGIPHRVGFAELAARPFLTTSLPWRGRKSGLHKSELYLELLELLTGKKTKLMASVPTNASSRGRTIVVGPGASLPLREWPYFVELCEAIPAKFPGYSLKIVGAPADVKWKSLFARSPHAKGWEDHIGNTTLGGLKEICSTASLVIANDTGLAHVAATLCGTPTLVLFGPGDPHYVMPRGEKVEAIRAEIPCSPCESATCRAPFGYQRCLREVPVTDVLARISRILSL